MLCTKVMVSLEYVPNDLLGVGDRLATVAQNCQSLAFTPLWGFLWFLLQLQPCAHQLFEDCSDTHGPSDIPTDKNQGGSSPVNEVPTRCHTSCWSAWSLSHPVKSVIWCVLGGAHLVETTDHFDQSVCDVRVMPKTSSALPHNVPYSPFEPSHFRLQTNTDLLCHVWKWLPMLCTLLSVTVSVRLSPEVLYPSKHYFCYWHVLIAESALRQRTKHDQKSLDCLRLCHKTIHTLQHVLPCQPLWAFALFGSGKDTNEDLIWEHASKARVILRRRSDFPMTPSDWLPYFIDVSFLS